MTIVIEDHPGMLEICRRHHSCFSNAQDGLNFILTGVPIERVYLDIHGIEKQGIDAETVAMACQRLHIKCILTSSDLEASERLSAKCGCQVGTKLQAMLDIE